MVMRADTNPDLRPAPPAEAAEAARGKRRKAHGAEPPPGV
jgi:hypothetical protein